jgi:hypothetical protein
MRKKPGFWQLFRQAVFNKKARLLDCGVLGWPLLRR